MKLNPLQLFIKRVFDIVISALGLIVLALPMVLISLLIKRDSEGPVFFRQIRVGKNQVPFEILKFRTMVVDAPKLGREITVGEDPRITKTGRILRKTKLDELPQLINVLKGDMSFVGPRPEVPRYVELYDDRQRQILSIRPGITDLASIEYRDEATVLAAAENPDQVYIEEIMPHKLDLNLKYMKNMGIFYDIKLILKTIYVVIFK